MRTDFSTIKVEIPVSREPIVLQKFIESAD